LNFFYVLDTFRNNAEECCETGRIQAESTKTCTMTLQVLITGNLSANCRFLTHICCLSNLHSYFCEEGLKTALRLLPCNQTKLQSKDSYQVVF
jgi:glutathione peroxidase-family protein